MKLPLLKYAYYFTFTSLLLSGCQSSKPVYLSSKNAGNYTEQTQTPASEKNLETQTSTPEQEPKTVAIPEEKVLYAANTTLPAGFSATTNADKQNPFSTDIRIPEKPEQTISVKAYDEPEKIRGRTLSGIFLVAGAILLLVALGLVIAGTSGAGIVAWIGGGLFLTGFIFTMVALLGR